jgi:hypothetical protein
MNTKPATHTDANGNLFRLDRISGAIAYGYLWNAKTQAWSGRLVYRTLSTLTPVA